MEDIFYSITPASFPKFSISTSATRNRLITGFYWANGILLASTLKDIQFFSGPRNPGPEKLFGFNMTR